MRTVRALGLRAQQLRTEAGLSQQQLADLAYVSRKWLNEFEQGKPNVSTAKVLDLFQALGYELADVPLDRKSGRSSDG